MYSSTLLYLILELYSWLRIIFQFQFFSKTIENNSKYSSSSVSVTVNIWSLTPYVWATSGWIEWIIGPTPSCLSVCRHRDRGNPPPSQSDSTSPPSSSTPGTDKQHCCHVGSSKVNINIGQFWTRQMVSQISHVIPIYFCLSCQRQV